MNYSKYEYYDVISSKYLLYQASCLNFNFANVAKVAAKKGASTFSYLNEEICLLRNHAEFQ